MADQINNEIWEKMKKKYLLVKKEGPNVHGVSPNIDPDVLPPWFDEIKFKKAQEHARKYYISLSASHFIGLLMVVQLPDSPLLLTGNSDTISNLFQRYISTQANVKTWYFTDVFDPKSAGYKVIRLVRRMHIHANNLLNKKSDEVQAKHRFWISQYGMAITQWAFIATAVLYPDKCGFHHSTEDDLDNLKYFWRVIGYLMGIEDQFNICSYSLYESRILYKIIFEKVYQPAILEALKNETNGYKMAHGIVKAFKPVNPTLCWYPLLKYWYKVYEVPIHIEIKGLIYKFRYEMTKFTYGKAFKSDFIHKSLTKLMLARVERFEKRKNEVVKKIDKKYPDKNYNEYPLITDIIDILEKK